MVTQTDSPADFSKHSLGLHRRACLTLAAILLALGLLGPTGSYAQDAACSAWSAKVLAAEGPVELKRANLAAWATALTEDRLCLGDSLRVGAFGRAAVVLPDDTVLRLDQFTTVTFTPPEDEKRSWLDLLTGSIHIISRDPRALRVTTPFANAGIEGTEFSVAVSDSQTDVAVFEGSVTLSNAAGQVDIGSDQIASADARSIGAPRQLGQPYQTRGWTRHYPLVLAGELPAPDAAVGADPAALAARAQSRLRVGRVAEAAADVGQALGLSADNPDALAVRTIVLLSEGQTEAAQLAVDAALASAPSAASAMLALSQIQQRQGDLDASLRTLREAAAADPENSLVWARLAEVNISLGDYDAGLEAAGRAETLDSTGAPALIATGFAALSAGDRAGAEAAFRAAVEREPAAPLGRLGLALALIRGGTIEQGRAELENAVLLDAGDGLVRSYMAKAYYDEQRAELAGSQLAAAMQLDPGDPTPWLYDALRRQNANDPVAALRNLQTATQLNQDRAIFRSRLQMDDDLAVRSAGRGSVYRDLGFEQLALFQGWMAVTAAPQDFSGHQLLADMYSALPRHQVARVNELYQAQLLQPGNSAATPAQLGEANLFMLDSAGPTPLAHLGLDPLLSRDGIRIQGSAITGGRDTHGETVMVSGMNDRIDYNVGAFHYQTAGFRDNNDLEQDTLSAYLQYRQSARTSLQLELRSTEIDRGDLQLLFDRDRYNPLERHTEFADSLRLGMRHVLSPRSLLVGSLAYLDADITATGGSQFEANTRLDGISAQLQHHYQSPRWNLVSGVSVALQDLDQSTKLALPIPFPPFLLEQSDRVLANLRFVSLYSYASMNLSDTVVLTTGASVDRLDGQALARNRVNPKIGLTWTPATHTVIRVSGFRTLSGPVISKQIIQPSLEPGHVAGFNQFFFGPEGDVARRFGVAVDHQLAAALHVGAEISRSEIETPLFLATGPMAPDFVLIDHPIDESLLRSYLYWTPHPRVALGATFEQERMDNHGEVLAEGFSLLKTRRLPLSAKYFSPSGFSAGLTATAVKQSGVFGGMGLPPTSDGDNFWVLDLSLGYRLPNRRGLIELTARNLTDEEFRFQDTDPETPRIFPDRFVGLRFTLSY